MPISDKQRKLIWAGAALFGIFYVAPWAIHNARIASSQPVAEAKPSPVQYAPVAPKPVLTPEEVLNAQVARMAGDWQGSGVLDGGPCRLSLQIRPNLLKPAAFTGYATTACNPTLMTLGQDKQKAMQTILKGATPTSDIMSGEASKGNLIFHVDTAIGTPLDGCPWTGLTVSPFGGQVAVVWTAGTCAGGQMVLNRVTNVQ